MDSVSTTESEESGSSDHNQPGSSADNGQRVVDANNPEYRTHTEEITKNDSDAKSPTKLLSPFGNHHGKKRKRAPEAGKTPRKKTPTSTVNDNYRQLLNRDIEDVVNQKGLPGDLPLLEPSQLGASFWTTEEKRIFFDALTRLGRHDLQGIATAIATKSEMEIHQYIMLLQEGVLQSHLLGSRHQNPGLTEVAAAAEVSPECCKALDEAADALSTSQWALESSQAKTEFGDWWLLDWKVAEEIDQRLGKEEAKREQQVEALAERSFEAQPKTSEDVPAFLRLLNLHNWLELSELIFMNPAAPRLDENWQSLVNENDQKPSIMYSAFSDFHNLAVSITKRLVQASLFFATSRLRAKPGKPAVKKTDVHAALKVLNMSETSNDFWIKAPRRFNLDVYPSSRIYKYKTIRSAKKLSQRISFDELEEILSSRSDWGPRTKSRDSSESGDARVPLNANDVKTMDSAEANSTNGVSDEGLSTETELSSTTAVSEKLINEINDDLSTASEESLQLEDLIYPSGSESVKYQTSASKRKRDRLQRETQHHEYAEALDRQASWLEEQRLWALLGQEPPSSVKPEEVELLEKPAMERGASSHMEDWTAWTARESEWERYPEIVPEEAFRKQKLRKRCSPGKRHKVRKTATQGAGESPQQASASNRKKLNSGTENDKAIQQVESLHWETVDGSQESKGSGTGDLDTDITDRDDTGSGSER